MGLKHLAYFCIYAGTLTIVVVGWCSHGFRGLDQNHLVPLGLGFVLVACVLEPLLLAETPNKKLLGIGFQNLAIRALLAAIACSLCWWVLYNLGIKFGHSVWFIFMGYVAAIGFGYLGTIVNNRSSGS